MDTFQNCFPEKTVKIVYKNRLPYLTAALRKSIKTKHILKHAYEKNPTIDNRLLCTTFNNKLTSLLRNREKEYIEEQLEFNKTNLPKSWKIIKEIVGKGKPHDSNPIKFNINGKETCDKHTITNAFNKYFVQVGPRLAKKIKNMTDPLTYVTPSVNSIFIPYVSENEITEVILSLKNSSAGQDSILASIAKPLIQYYIKPLTCLINSSFENGLFPDELKIPKVIPIFKTGDKKDTVNYRPISILTFFSKIFEKTMYNHLISFIDKEDILYKFQFGFRKSHSTNHAIISLVEKVNQALDSGKVLVGIFLDLKKAFDTVDHKILVDKLFKYGIRGNIFNWLKSYLSNRKQYVNWQGSNSEIETTSCGVPQGSILGPLLFILYVNDLSKVSNKFVSILFADDTTILFEGHNIDSIVTSLNYELVKLIIWLNANKLSINVSKTHYMVFHRARRKVDHKDIILNNYILQQVHFTKKLGIIIDDKLKWANHISYIKNKIAKGMGILLKARKVLKIKALLQLYNSFVFPYLIYCSEVWGNASDIHLQPLIILQKKFIIIISFSRYNAPSKLLFQQYNILPLKKLVFQRLGLQLYKYEFGIIPIPLRSSFTKNSSVHNYNT